MGSIGSLYIERVTSFGNQGEEGFDEFAGEYPTLRNGAVENMSYQVDQPKAEQVRECYYKLAFYHLTEPTTERILGTSPNHIRFTTEGDIIMLAIEPLSAAQAQFANGYEQINLEALSYEQKVARATHLLKSWEMLGQKMSIEILFDCATIRIATVGTVTSLPMFSQPVHRYPPNQGYGNALQSMIPYQGSSDGFSYGGQGTRG